MLELFIGKLINSGLCHQLEKAFPVLLVLLSNTVGWKILGERTLFQKSGLLKIILINFNSIKVWSEES